MKERLDALKTDVQMRIEAGAPWTPVPTDLLASILGLSAIEYCEHGIVLGEWCPDCNADYKQAAIDNAEDDDEPVGSCDQCGMDIYAHDDGNLCDQCSWARSH